MATVWPSVAGHVERAVTEGIPRNDLADIYDKLVADELQLWVVYGDGVEAVVVTRLVGYPLIRALRIVICIGDGYNRWVHLLGTIEGWARERGCGVVECVARPGWERVLRDYKKSHVILERRLDDA